MSFSLPLYFLSRSPLSYLFLCFYLSFSHSFCCLILSLSGSVYCFSYLSLSIWCTCLSLSLRPPYFFLFSPPLTPVLPPDRYIAPDKREENDQSTHKWMVYVRGSKKEPSIDHFVRKVWFFLHPSYKPNDLVEVRYVFCVFVCACVRVCAWEAPLDSVHSFLTLEYLYKE